MKAHLARHGIRHVEAKFPKMEELMHFVSEAPWTRIFRNDSERLARWRSAPPQRASGTGIWCRADRTLGIACEACAMSSASDGAAKDGAAASDGAMKRLRPCPREHEPMDLEWPDHVPEEATAQARRAYQPSERLWEQVFSGRDGMAFV